MIWRSWDNPLVGIIENFQYYWKIFFITLKWKFEKLSKNRQNITETTFYDIIISSTDIESTEIPNDVFSTTDAICLDNSRPTFSQSCPDEFISQSEFSEVIFAICVSAIIMVPSITVAVMLILTSNAKNVKKQFEVKRRRSRAMSLVVYNRQGSIHSHQDVQIMV